jgi:hypothetical protein
MENKMEKTEKTVTNGLVCFFDIMGYQNILLKNSITECARLIKDILFHMPEDVENDLFSIGEAFGRKDELEDFFKKFFHKIMISDTVIFFFDLDKIKENNENLLLIALIFIRKFQYESFNKGLPMRGSLDFGEYYYYDNLFAGKTIVNTYTECNNINFSGITMSKNAYDYFKSLGDINVKIFLKYFIFECLVPLKQKEEKKYIMKWYDKVNYQESKDVKQYIFNSFYMHNKDVNSNALEKINNTEKILRYFLLQEELTLEKKQEERS